MRLARHAWAADAASYDSNKVCDACVTEIDLCGCGIYLVSVAVEVARKRPFVDAFGQEIGVLFGHHTRAAQNTNGAQQHTTQFMINSTHDFVTIVPRTGTTASVAGV